MTLTVVGFFLQRSKGWGDIPPAPNKQDMELKYLELSLDNPYNDNDSHSLSVQNPGQSTPTEYKEIDFVKTKGLHDLKSKVQNDRKHDEAWRQVAGRWTVPLCDVEGRLCVCGVWSVFLGGVCGIFMPHESGSVCGDCGSVCVVGGSECGGLQSLSNYPAGSVFGSCCGYLSFWEFL